MTYDGDYTISLAPYSGNEFNDIDYNIGMIVGNGKIVGTTSKNLGKLEKTLMAAEYVYDKNSSTNTIPIFNTTIKIKSKRNKKPTRPKNPRNLKAPINSKTTIIFKNR